MWPAQRALCGVGSAARDARDVHQIVDQSDHLVNLAVHHGSQLFHAGRIALDRGPGLKAITDRRQGFRNSCAMWPGTRLYDDRPWRRFLHLNALGDFIFELPLPFFEAAAPQRASTR